MTLNDWQPRSEAQAFALASPADILLFGGSAGSLKSETLLVDALRQTEHPWARGLLLRRSVPELERTLIRRSHALLAGSAARYHEGKRRWSFPNGACLEFGYCERDVDVHRYQGAEFTFIGFDESTHFSEFPLRYMLSRLRSTDPAARLRLRLASNPGNIGHATHKAIFLGSHCPHCHPPARGFGFRLRSDAVWPSDNRPIGKTTCFVPGRVSDHDLLPPDYAASLASLGGAFRKALLEGCWDVYEGQYFDNWQPDCMVVRRQMVGDQPWWPHWVGVDYGFNGSQAAAYLLCKSPATPAFPDGRICVIEEFTARHQPAAAFACALRDRFAVRDRHIQAWYLSPDAWNQRGDGHTLADQMQQASGIGFAQASNDRVGGAMLLYSQLDRGELMIADTCPQLLETIPTRIHDPERPDDIRKITGDPLDDCLDAVRYALYSYPPPARPGPGGDLSALVTSSDPTIAALQTRLASQRWQERGTPRRYVPTRGH